MKHGGAQESPGAKCHVLEKHCVEAHRLTVRQRPDKGLAENQEPGLRAALITSVSDGK